MSHVTSDLVSAPGAPDRTSGRYRREARPLWRQVAGSALRERRRAAGLRLRDVAQRAGISVQYLSEVERGRKEPSSEMVESICGALGLDLLDLVRDVGRRLVREAAQHPALRGGAAAMPVRPPVGGGFPDLPVVPDVRDAAVRFVVRPRGPAGGRLTGGVTVRMAA